MQDNNNNTSLTRVERLPVPKQPNELSDQQLFARTTNYSSSSSKRFIKPSINSRTQDSIKMMAKVTLFIASLILATSVPAVAASGDREKSPQAISQQQVVTDRNGNTITNGSTFGELVAVGAISLLSPASASSSSALNHQHLPVNSGRLIDRIAIERSQQLNADSNGNANGNGNNNSNNNKLDYIVEFLRHNKLSKFCDLLTNQLPEIRDISRRLNSMQQFTLFVPTNEALLLMPTETSEQIAHKPEEMRQFLLAHATGELIVPKLDPIAQRELLAANRWSSIRAGYHSSASNYGAELFAPSTAQASTSLIYSLAGTQLRVTSAPINYPANATSPLTTTTTTKLELIVNGANVLSGHSHALQEPNNTNVTYAIVHLIDRSLYPAPSSSLGERIRQLSPRFAHYVGLAKDERLNEALESSRQVWTLFLPSDDAFKATPVKLMDQLNTNRTFLIDFLRHHIVEGLHYSIQLSTKRANDRATAQPVRLSSQSGNELEVETKWFPARSLLTVNSIPVAESDIMATNGVIHLVTRPIFERDQLESCNCDLNLQSNGNETSNEATTVKSNSVWPSGNRVQASAIENWSSMIERPTNGNELEREESQLVASGTSARVRSQRSGSLAIERNNRDFYRPSAAPANLLLAQSASQQVVNTRRPDGQPIIGQGFISSEQVDELNRLLTAQRLANETNNRLTAAKPDASIRRPTTAPTATSFTTDLFEAERYKVLNASTRRQMREQNQADWQLNNPASQLIASGSKQLPRFTYDKPLTTQPTVGNEFGELENSPGKRLNYWALNSTANPHSSSNISGWSPESSFSSSASNQRLMLKFQPEDARDLIPAANRLQNATFGLQPAYDIINQQPNQLTSKRQMNLAAKTVAPPGFNGCAFYDADCKRLMGKLVRLPPTGSKNTLNSQLSVSSSTNSPLTFNNSRSSSNNRLVIIDQHLDSTFGETTENPLQTPRTFIASQPLPVVTTPTSSLFSPNRIVGSANQRVSPLNQPLPPWNPEEDARKTAAGSWRADTEITRIREKQVLDANNQNYGHGFTSGLSREQSIKSTSSSSTRANQSVISSAGFTRPPNAQILLVPVRMLQQQQTNRTSIQLNPEKPIYFSPPLMRPTVNNQQSSALQNFNNLNLNTNFHAPTTNPSMQSPASANPLMQNPNAFHVPNLGRLTNFTAFETIPGNFEDTSTPTKSLKSPSLIMSNQRKSRLQFDTNGTLTTASNNPNADFPINNQQNPRKIVRLQPTPSGVWSPNDDFNGDISITSAKLTRTGNSTGALAVQASNQSPNAVTGGNSNFVRSIPSAQLQAELLAADPQQSSPSGDFFQNRTIADIMDDSGLRIDGQQVTFVRLKECLKDADLLNLVAQTGNSLTIFMPTDLAFQRLVQQQAITHQKERQQSSLRSNSISARLLDPNRRHLIPLIARTSRPSAPSITDNNNGLSGRLTFDPIDSSATTAADRLTLDCSTTQVRQLLLDHISARLIAPKQLLSDTILTSLSGRQLLLSSVPSKKIVVVDGQPVIAATRAKNGMVYVVNKFLNVTQQVPNVIDLIETQPNLSTFLSYLTFSSLADRLKRESGPITILAPTNEAFEQLSTSARQLINSDPSALMDILRGHVVEGAQFGKLISMRNRLRTLNTDQNIEAKVIKPNLYQLDNQMTSMRLVGTTGNGVVNSIDRLIVPPWLKISMSPRTQTGSSTLPSVDNRSVISSPFVGEFDASIDNPTSLNNSISSLNLPLIGRQPTRFEQPAGSRLNPIPTGSSAFANNNFLDSFDFVSTDSPLIGDAQRSPFATTFNRTNQFDRNRPISPQSQSVNRTKNMQLIEKLTNLMQTKKFVEYLLRSKISDSLKPDMNYVILVPTDQAVEKLPKQIIDMLDKDPDRLSDLVNYHVLDTTFEYINTIPDGTTLNTLNEKDILFNWHRNNTILTASGAVVLGGIQEENIALLIVDRVLYPTPGDILNIISKSPILSNFTALVRQTGLEKQLSLVGPYTLFAPSDFAFNQLDKRDLEFLQRNKETARRLLLRHLSQPAIFTSSIALSNNTMTSSATNQTNRLSPILQTVPTMIISNSLGEDLTLRQRNEYFSVNDVNFSYADVAATNGVVHVIDGLL